MSAEVGVSRPSDVPALKALWKGAFGDTDACIDAFFARLYRPETVLTAREGARVLAMACWLPETLCYEKRGWPAAYLYAVATDPSARGRGLCTLLLDFAAEFLAPRGVRALVLVPGEPSLRGFYARRGYRDYTTVDTWSVAAAAADGRVEPLSAPAYLELREDFLSDRAYLSCPAPVLAYQRDLARQAGGDFYRVELNGAEALACAAVEQGRAVLSELLTAGDPRPAAAFLAHTLGAKTALARAPGTKEPFAMARFLGAPPPCPAPYFGIALD